MKYTDPLAVFHRNTLAPVIKSYRDGRPVLIPGATLRHLMEAARMLGKAEVRRALAAIK